MWILVIFFTVGSGGYNSGPPINFQEFTSRERCEAASLAIDQKTSHKLPWPKDIAHPFSGFCIEK